MSPRKIFLSTFCLAIFLSACNKDNELYVVQPDSTIEDNDHEQTDYSSIDPVFEGFVERFIEEGEKRGFSVDLASHNITIHFTNIDQEQSPNVVGMCSYNSLNQNDITIDYNFWQQAGDLQKEFILFHELGHCYLKRGHQSDAFQNGICVSIMRGADPGCSDAYTAANRDYYIDELFSVLNTRDALS